MADFTVREGLTDPIVFQCKQIDPTTGVESIVPLTGATAPELHVRKHGAAAGVTYSGAKVTITDIPLGKVTFSPAAGDLTAGLYDVFLRVTDGTGKIIGFPNGDDFELGVLPNY